jgi:hypothetical protein
MGSYKGKKVAFASLCISSVVIVLGLVELARYEMNSHSGSDSIPSAQKLDTGMKSPVKRQACVFAAHIACMGLYTATKLFSICQQAFLEFFFQLGSIVFHFRTGNHLPD